MHATLQAPSANQLGSMFPDNHLVLVALAAERARLALNPHLINTVGDGTEEMFSASDESSRVHNENS